MSSNDPPPTGKFRPRKKAPSRTSSGSRITPGATTTGAAAATTVGVDAGASAAGDTSRSGRGGRGRPRSRSPGAGRGGRGRGRGGGGGRGGRGGRAGRFVMPQGRAFFTGGQAGEQAMAAAAAAAAAASGTTSAASGASPATGGSSSAAGAMARPGSAASSSRTVRPSASGSSRSRSPAGGRRRSGLEEGEETVLGEIEGGGVGGAALTESGKIGKVESTLPGSGAGGGGGGGRDSHVLFDDEEHDAPAASTARVGSRKSAGDDAYMYDSDSSNDEMRKGGSEPAWSSLAPVQLPLPPPRKHILYECQRGENASAATSATTVSTAAFPDAIASVTSEEKKGDDSHAVSDAEGSAAPVFLDIDTATEDDRRIEADSWTLFKLPTRLPRIAPRGRVKSEAGGDGVDPMQVESSDAAGGQLLEQHQRYPGAPTPANRFDDTLRSAPSGRYGKIRIRKSGKAVLVVGEGTAEEVTLDLNEGIPCSMMQQAVNIDPIEGTYVSMGEIHRSIVATPDIASAFPNA